ncbi:neuronal acetylcholine receptor subunit beta-4-like [Amphiura filiformis]|uniref:neuronal acetylcholine receptor subunit beta-4-like n=1 Tax=Amphiura filiformis TaxID=82378 RepID=UPI003B21AE42
MRQEHRRRHFQHHLQHHDGLNMCACCSTNTRENTETVSANVGNHTRGMAEIVSKIWLLKYLWFHLVFTITLLPGSLASEAAERLYSHLTQNYDELIRPVLNESEPVMIKFGLSISQLIDIDERNQIMTTSMWVKHEWKDHSLAWNKDDYDGIGSIHIPASEIWRPDILLYNNADGFFDVQFLVNAVVSSDGKVIWVPPAIYKSSCKINIEYFPFDEQKCTMKFGPWTHDTAKVDMLMSDKIVDQEDYWENGEWQIMESPAKLSRVDYPCCPNEFYVDITFEFILHRKPLFYVVTLVVPCLLISFLTILVFYLPSDNQEKITLSISILLALIVFLLLIPSIIPPTSTTLPLIGRYMLFTMVLVTSSITLTVVVINVHFRSPRTHTMPNWVKTVFLQYLPTVVCLRRPDVIEDMKKYKELKKVAKGHLPKNYFKGLNGHRQLDKRGTTKATSRYILNTITPSLLEEIEHRDKELVGCSNASPINTECADLVDSVEIIVNHLKSEDENAKAVEEWKFVAMVIDRIFLWMFSILCLFGTLGLILNAPMLWEASNMHPVVNYTKPEVLSTIKYNQSYRPDF